MFDRWIWDRTWRWAQGYRENGHSPGGRVQGKTSGQLFCSDKWTGTGSRSTVHVRWIDGSRPNQGSKVKHRREESAVHFAKSAICDSSQPVLVHATNRVEAVAYLRVLLHVPRTSTHTLIRNGPMTVLYVLDSIMHGSGEWCTSTPQKLMHMTFGQWCTTFYDRARVKHCGHISTATMNVLLRGGSRACGRTQTHTVDENCCFLTF